MMGTCQCDMVLLFSASRGEWVRRAEYIQRHRDMYERTVPARGVVRLYIVHRKRELIRNLTACEL